MPGVFKAYDIRGIYPSEINSNLVKKVILCLVQDFFEEGSILVGHDPRIGSEELYNTAIKTLRDEGREVLEGGLMTTPMLNFLVHDLEAVGGVMITASHNPKEYNGMKIIRGDGSAINGEDIYKKIG